MKSNTDMVFACMEHIGGTQPASRSLLRWLGGNWHTQSYRKYEKRERLTCVAEGDVSAVEDDVQFFEKKMSESVWEVVGKLQGWKVWRSASS